MEAFAEKVANFAAADQPPLVRAAALRRLRASGHWSTLLEALDDEDAWIRQAAHSAVAASNIAPLEQTLRESPSARQRQELALLLRRSYEAAPPQGSLERLLNDTSVPVQAIALQWIGETHQRAYEEELQQRLARGQFSAELLEPCLAALSLLRGAAPAEYEQRSADMLGELLEQRDIHPRLLVHILRHLPADHAAWRKQQWPALLAHDDPDVRLEAVRTLRESRNEQRTEWLKAVVNDAENNEVLRSEAVAGFSPENAASRQMLMTMALKEQGAVQRQALRALRDGNLSAQERSQLQQLQQRVPDVSALVELLLRPEEVNSQQPPRDDLAAWMQATAGGDPEEGRRIFFHPRGARCYTCHRVEGRGGAIGPDLSGAGRLGRARLLQSLLQPSAEVAPQYVTWVLQLKNGRVLTGMLITESGDQQTFADSSGELFVVEREAIEVRQPAAQSLMPERLLQSLTAQEVSHLLAFLTQISS